MSQQNTLLTNNQRQIAHSESHPKTNNLPVKSPQKQEDNQIWPERHQYSQQKQNYTAAQNGIGPRFKNTATSKPNMSPSPNSPLSSATYVHKVNQQPPRLMNKKIAQNTPRNGVHLTEKTPPQRPIKYDSLSISL